MGVVGYLLWLMFQPFISALALAAIIVTICYPLYERILKITPKRNSTLAALFSTILILVIIIIPLLWLSSTLFNETLVVYKMLGDSQHSLADSFVDVEKVIQNFAPTFELNINEYLKQAAEWLAGNLGAIFAGTASTIFAFFIAIIGSFYFFRDGREFTKVLIRISPLPDNEDSFILKRMAVAVRSVVVGTVFVAIIQGTLTAIGLTVAGFDRAILLGTIAALAALVPSVGTSIVLVPAIAYLIYTGSYVAAGGLAIWAALAVGLIDNILGPYLMSRGSTIHPFLILLSVLGGIGMFGPIGFIVGPVLVSLFIVLLELYAQHIANTKK